MQQTWTLTWTLVGSMWKLLRSGLPSFNSILADIYCSCILPAELVDSLQFVLNICGCFCECVCWMYAFITQCIWCTHQIHSLGASSVVALYCPILPRLTLFPPFFDFPMVYIPFTDSICLLELFTFFRDTVIHWIYKYNSICLYVVYKLDSCHSLCNLVQRIRCVSCAFQ